MTRIIGGTAGGRRIDAPRGTSTRPSSDRVREALFSAIESWCGTLQGLRFLDLYAGSGAVGLEAWSRGAGIVTLVLPFAARAFVRGIVLLAAGCVWLATSLSMGVSVWTMVVTAWRNAAGVMATPTASAILWSLVVLGAIALYWLQRLLSSEEE